MKCELKEWLEIRTEGQRHREEEREGGRRRQGERYRERETGRERWKEGGGERERKSGEREGGRQGGIQRVSLLNCTL